MQRKVEIELLKRQKPAAAGEIRRRQEDIRVLERGFAPAKDWILKQGPILRRLSRTSGRSGGRCAGGGRRWGTRIRLLWAAGAPGAGRR